MKKLQTTVVILCFAIIIIGLGIALVMEYFGWENVQIFVWFLSVIAAYWLGRYHTGRDMVSGAKLALVSQESDDRRERASMQSLGQFIGILKNQGATPQQALPSGDKEKVVSQVNDLHALIEELDDRIGRLKNQCPTDWSPDKIELESRLTKISNVCEECWANISGAEVGG